MQMMIIPKSHVVWTKYATVMFKVFKYIPRYAADRFGFLLISFYFCSVFDNTIRLGYYLLGYPIQCDWSIGWHCYFRISKNFGNFCSQWTNFLFTIYFEREIFREIPSYITLLIQMVWVEDAKQGSENCYKRFSFPNGFLFIDRASERVNESISYICIWFIYFTSCHV